MNKGAWKKKKWFTACAVVCMCVSISAHASNLYVSDLQTSTPGKFFTYKNGVGEMNVPSGYTGLMKLVDDGEIWNYSISGKIYITSALVTDTSSGVLASGQFAAGRTITVTGSIKYIPTNTIFYTGTILTGVMDEPASTWVLAESPSLAINGSAEFLPNLTVGLGSGIAFGSDILKIGRFRVDFAFKGVNPNPSKFNTTQTLMGTTSTIQFVAIPEPATLLLLSTAALALRIRTIKERNHNKKTLSIWRKR